MSLNQKKIEEDLTSILRDVFKTTKSVCGEEDCNKLVDMFSLALRRHRDSLDPHSEVVITRAFLDAKYSVKGN